MSRKNGPPEEVSYAVPGITMQAFIVDPLAPRWLLLNDQRDYPGIRTVDFVIDEAHTGVELAPCLRTDLVDITALDCRSARYVGGLAEIVVR